MTVKNGFSSPEMYFEIRAEFRRVKRLYEMTPPTYFAVCWRLCPIEKFSRVRISTTHPSTIVSCTAQLDIRISEIARSPENPWPASSQAAYCRPKATHEIAQIRQTGIRILFFCPFEAEYLLSKIGAKRNLN